jgi:hypothetical protein
MSAKQTVRYQCKCSRVDPEHTVEESADGWTRYVFSSYGRVKFAWSGGAVKDPNEKGLQPIHRYRVYGFG